MTKIVSFYSLLGLFDMLDRFWFSFSRTPFQEACANLVAKKYNDIIPHLNIELENESSPYVPEALLLRATFLTLAGCPGQAENDLNRLLDMQDVKNRVSAIVCQDSLH